MFCCEECQNYDSCTELGALTEECCSRCIFYEECKKEGENEEDSEEA